MNAKRKAKPKTILIDYDDTVISFLQTLCKIHNQKYGTCITHNDIKTWDFEAMDVTDARGNRVTGQDLRDTFKYFEDHGMYAALKPLPYAKYALDTAHEIGYKVIILTARPEKYRIATEWNLLANDLYYDELFFEKDKVKKIKELSKTHNIVFFADDKPTTVHDVAENCKVKNVFLIKSSVNESSIPDLHEDVKIANDLMDCIKELKQINK